MHETDVAQYAPPKDLAKSASLTAARLLTKRQAADYLQTSTRYVERMVALGRLRAFKPTGKVFRVSKRDLDAFLESGASIAA
jgi:excisionase family DNA binding protein